MKPEKTKVCKGGGKVKLRISKLKAGTTYYVRSRPYRKYKGHKYTGVLNAARKVKTEK